MEVKRTVLDDLFQILFHQNEDQAIERVRFIKLKTLTKMQNFQ